MDICDENFRQLSDRFKLEAVICSTIYVVDLRH